MIIQPDVLSHRQDFSNGSPGPGVGPVLRVCSHLRTSPGPVNSTLLPAVTWSMFLDGIILKRSTGQESLPNFK